MPSISRSFAPRIDAAVARPPIGRTSGSAVPWIDERRQVELAQRAPCGCPSS